MPFRLLARCQVQAGWAATRFKESGRHAGRNANDWTACIRQNAAVPEPVDRPWLSAPLRGSPLLAFITFTRRAWKAILSARGSMHRNSCALGVLSYTGTPWPLRLGNFGKAPVSCCMEKNFLVNALGELTKKPAPIVTLRQRKALMFINRRKYIHQMIKDFRWQISFAPTAPLRTTTKRSRIGTNISGSRCQTFSQDRTKS